MDYHQHVAIKLWQELQHIRSNANVEVASFNEAVFFLTAIFAIDAQKSEFVAGRLFPIDIRQAIHYLLRDAIPSAPPDQLVDKALRIQSSLYGLLDLPRDSASHSFKDCAPALGYVIEVMRRYRTDFEDNWLTALDLVYSSSIEKPTPPIARATRHGVELALNFLPKDLEIAEYFLFDGELATKAAQLSRLNVGLIRGPTPSEANPRKLALRLAIWGVLLRKEVLGESLKAHDLVFISHPRHRITRGARNRPVSSSASSSAYASSQALERYDSAIEALDVLYQRAMFGLAVVAVPVSDCLSSGWKADLRRDLVTQGRIIAVIGGAGYRKTDKKICYWIVTNMPRAEGTLFINLESLAVENDADFEAMMSFASKIVRSLYPFIGSDFVPALEETRYQGLYSRHFRSGYQDVAGLCQVVHIENISSTGWSLDVKNYVGRHDQIARVSHRRLDSHMVMEILRGRQWQQCIYIIGANGQGKSLLLAEISDELEEFNIRSAGLSFGQTDRFRANTNGGLFTYLGARTSGETINLTATKRRLENHIRSIAAQPHRLTALSAAMTMLGFGHRLYIVPNSVKLREEHIPDEKVAQIIELSAQDRDDILALPPKFSLAVVPHNPNSTKNSILTFDRLSSGEQQVITLAIKLCASADVHHVMLVDEPEISLHVSWQRTIPAMLKKLSHDLQCAVVVATHSPILIASTDATDHCFVAQDQVLEPIPRDKLASVDSILFEEFGTYTNNTRRVHELCASVVARTMRNINAEDGLLNQDEKAKVLAELDSVKEIVASAPMTATGREQDLELIERAHAAIGELFNQNATRPGIELGA